MRTANPEMKRATAFAARFEGALWPLIACLAWLLATIGVRPLMAPDEGRYVGVALSMLHSHDWLVPHLDGLPFFHKPPLFYWIGAAAMALAGPHEWAARLPSVLGGMLAAASLFLFLRRWSTPERARLALLVLATMPFFFIGAQFANLDMLVAGCISATVLSGAWAVLARDAGADAAWRWPLAGAFFFAAAGLLAKGLIGIVLPGMVLVAWCLVTRRAARLRLVFWLPGWLLLLAIAGPWFVAMQLRFPGFFDYFVITQHFRRFASAGFNNPHAFWFYLPVIAGLSLPWFAWVAAAWRKVPGERRWLSDVDLLMAIWLAVVVVFFSLPTSKLIGYVLPALSPLAALLAALILRGRQAHAPMPLVKATAWAAAAICIAGVVAVAKLDAPPGTRLALTPGTHIAPDARVVMLGTYFYEVPFYWRLERPVPVVSDWNSPGIDAHDNWQKEFVDAGRFDPARASQVLLTPDRLAAVLCVPQTTWLVGPSNASLAYPWLSVKDLVGYNDQAAVWRFAGSPSGDPHCLDVPGR
jgi:4-amino-4-deoxy-L-arabinose transferase-like glycosyltransferase